MIYVYCILRKIRRSFIDWNLDFMIEMQIGDGFIIIQF